MPRELRAVPTVPVHLKAALSVPEITEMVGLSAPAVYRLVERGVLARVPHTSRLLVARAELDRWVTSTMPRSSVAS